MTVAMVYRSERRKLCVIMTELCDERISGNDFCDELTDIEPGDDSALEMVVGWLFDEWEPEWPTSRQFDLDNPPFRVRRQLALFRRFLLSEEQYKWPDDAYTVDGFPTLRLLAAGLSCSAAMVTITISLHHLGIVPFALAFSWLAGWLIVRERSANQRDADRVHARASRYGDPEWWPFLNGEAYRSAGSSRRRAS
jgi:hypothetical protein